jgi:hypothetical protein
MMLATAASAISPPDPWAINANGTIRMPCARRAVKSRMVQPAVESIQHAGNAIQQGALLHAITDHPSLASAHEVAKIDSSKDTATIKFLFGQSARMMEWNRSTTKLRGNSTAEKHDAVEAVLTFSAPLPEKVGAEGVGGVPSMFNCAWIHGVPLSLLKRMDKHLIDKRRQLTAGEKGTYWVLAEQKKGFSKIDDALRSLLVDAFNDHPHVIMSPNSKDTLQLNNPDGEKVLVRKILMQVGLGTIFSEIIRDNPPIKNKVGERVFHHVISGRGCVRRFTDSHKQMCGCTECVGLQMMHCLLQAKRGVMHRQFAINTSHRTRKAQAEEKARGWGTVE